MIITPATITRKKIIIAADVERAARIIWARIDRSHEQIDYWATRTAHVKALARLAAPNIDLSDEHHEQMLHREIFGAWTYCDEEERSVSDLKLLRDAITLLRRAVTAGDFPDFLIDETGLKPLPELCAEVAQREAAAREAERELDRMREEMAAKRAAEDREPDHARAWSDTSAELK